MIAAPGSRALTGTRVVFPAALGPVPFAAMLLADLGAEVIRIDRAGAAGVIDTRLEDDPRTRGQRAIGLDLKSADGAAAAARLIGTSDVVMEGMRPGAMERLGLGPDEMRAAHPGLIYARMTGWGQSGPLALEVGHDINYLARSGALYPMGPADRAPTVPLNLVADFGGGGCYLAMGVLAALLQRAANGRGQLIDCAMVDGVASLTTMIHGMLASGSWTEHRDANLLDGGAPFYRCYATSDGGYVAVGAIEPAFFRSLMTGVGLSAEDWPQQDRERWPALAERLATIFGGQSRSHWGEHFRGANACVSPVLTPSEAAADPDLGVRQTFVDWDGVRQPAPAPRLSDSPPVAAPRSPAAGDTRVLLAELGYAADEVDALVVTGSVWEGR